MNTVKFLSLVLISSIVLFSCKESETELTETTVTSEKELAMAVASLTKKPTETYLYVTASTGLSLREYANLQSEKLAVMPYGTRVKVITSEKNNTMKVGEIKGGMNEIEYNQKKGFAFNGFLSKYFPPEKGISTKGYAEELKENFSGVTYSETVGGTASKPTNTETLILPEAAWNEAFNIAQQLYKLPKEFVFPSSKGKEFQIIKEKDTSTKTSTNSWISELQIFRKEDVIKKIEYIYKNKGFSKTVSISKEGNSINISSKEIVE